MPSLERSERRLGILPASDAEGCRRSRPALGDDLSRNFHRTA